MNKKIVCRKEEEEKNSKKNTCEKKEEEDCITASLFFLLIELGCHNQLLPLCFPFVQIHTRIYHVLM